MTTLYLPGGISASFQTPEDAVAFLRAYQSGPSVTAIGLGSAPVTPGSGSGFVWPQPLGSVIRT